MKKFLILGTPFEICKGGAEYQYMLIEKEFVKYFDLRYLFAYPEKTTNPKYLTYFYKFRKYYHKYIFTDALKIYRLTKLYSPDIIYKRGVNYISAVGVIYSLFHKCRMILHISSDKDVLKYHFDFARNNLYDLIDYIIRKFVIKNSRIIICQTEYQHQQLQRNFNRNSGAVIRNLSLNHSLKEFYKNKDLIRVLWIANFKELKKPELFIKLAENFIEQSAIEFLMIGRKPTDNNGAELEYASPPNVKVFGELPLGEVEKFLIESHILVNTSIMEGFPNSFIQAWLNEVVVVSLNVDPDDILKSEKIGFHSGTFEQMVKDVKLLISNEQLRHEMAVRSRVYAEKHFDLNTNLKKLAALFN